MAYFSDFPSLNFLNEDGSVQRVKDILRRVVFTDEAIFNESKTELKIDLPNQLISICDSKLSENFEINSYKKENMINGYDDIDYLCSMKSKIKEFESKSPL